MTAIASNQAGFYDVTSTWIGGVVPVAGDTITTNHDVTVRNSHTIGHSPGAGDATKAVLCNTGKLIVANGGTLRVRGDIGCNAARFEVQAGGAVIQDASQAGTPATALYIAGSTNANAGNGVVLIQGSSGNRASWSSDAGGANGRIEYNESGEIDFAYCDFVRVGDSTHPAIKAAAGSGQKFRAFECTFDSDCGKIGDQTGVGCASDSIIEIKNSIHDNATDSIGIPADVYNPAGTRTIDGCYFAGSVSLFRIDGYDITNNTFGGNIDYTGSGWKSNVRNIIAYPEAAGGDYPIVDGEIVDPYLLRLGDPTNAHGLTTGDTTRRIVGMICDMPDGTDGAGDMITFNNPAAIPKQPIEITGCILLKREDGGQVGTLSSALGGSNLRFQVNHCTIYSEDSQAASAIYLGETFAGVAGMLVACHSNITHHASASHAGIITADPGATTDVVRGDCVHHNGKFNQLGTGYSTNLSFSQRTQPGSYDVVGDPGFVDADRNIKTWDASLGGPGTTAHALSSIRARTAGYTIDALFDYIRAGHAITNHAMRVGDVNGNCMGAVQGAPTWTPDQTKFPKPVIARLAQQAA